MLVLMIWVRATVPRMRYDRLMQFGWKVMMPLALLGVGWSAVALIVGDTLNSPLAYLGLSALFLVIVLVAAMVVLRPSVDAADNAGVEVIDLEHRHGLRYVALNTVGTLLSVPFWVAGNVARIGRGTKS